MIEKNYYQNYIKFQKNLHKALGCTCVILGIFELPVNPIIGILYILLGILYLGISY